MWNYEWNRAIFLPPRFYIPLIINNLQSNKFYQPETFNLEVKLYTTNFVVLKNNKKRIKNEKNDCNNDATFRY